MNKPGISSWYVQLPTLLAVGVVVTVVLLVWLARDTDERIQANHLRPMLQGHELLQPSDDGMNKPKLAQANPPTRTPLSITVEVVDAVTEEPIVDALIGKRGCACRFLTGDSACVIGATDRSGRIALSYEAFEAASFVTAIQYTPAVLDTTERSSRSHRVLLSRGHALHVQCKTTSGQPLKDCTVVASQVGLPSRSAQRALMSSPTYPGAVASRISVAHPDASSMAALTLLPGRYLVSAIAKGHVLVEKEPMAPAEIPGTQSLSITLAPIHAVAFQVVGDELLGYSVDSAESAYSNNTRVLSDLDCEAKLLKARLPGAETAAYAIHDSTQPGPASVHMLLLERGLVTVPARLQELEAINEAETIDVSSFPPIKNCWPTLVRILDADGRDVDLDAFVLVVDGVALAAKPGVMMLPAGKHRVVCTDGVLQGMYRPSEFEIPGDIDIQVLRHVRECKLRVMDGDGNECQRFLLSVKSPGAAIASVVYDARSMRLALPIGQAVFNVDAWGYSKKTQSIDIGFGDGLQNILVVLDSQEAKGKLELETGNNSGRSKR